MLGRRGVWGGRELGAEGTVQGSMGEESDPEDLGGREPRAAEGRRAGGSLRLGREGEWGGSEAGARLGRKRGWGGREPSLQATTFLTRRDSRL